MLLVAAAVAVGWWLNRRHVPIYAGSAPLFATPGPHVGIGTVLAPLVAAAVVGGLPRLADRLGWRRLLLTAYVAALAWILSLAMIDGWRNGLTSRLTGDAEYLIDVPGVTDIPAMLRTFTDRILDFQPDSWHTHVSGHPPGALLLFVLLDRIGLGGGTAAALLCVLVGALTAVAVPVTLRALGDEPAARAVLPFVVLFPGAVWLGASADAIFAGVTATGIAALAVAGRRRGPVLALAAGALLGYGVFLSYGLVLMAPIALVPALVSRRLRATLFALAGAVAVVAVFAAAGFWWYDGYRLVVERYYQGIGRERPYAYWVWANLATLVLAAGPATAPILRRAVVALGPAAPGEPGGAGWDGRGGGSGAPRHARPAPPGAVRRFLGRLSTGPVALPLAAVVAIVAADLSGLSKAEVERIWLPFGVWLMAGATLLPARHRRWWLVAQAVTALAVNHLVLTVW
ncbi:hypothetical protein AB0M79_13220 [Polymorphospora sp. NPDC051019]|uniref:hypothetical protein n=1 Tax=Polymorphospora sp. NPDC051019 TaxID=3155725 RepID=UPI00341BE837